MASKDLLKKRVYAFTFDLFVVVVTNYFLMASFTEFIRTVFFRLPHRMQMFFIYKIQMMSSITLMLLTFAYFSVFYFTTNGKTLGKLLWGLKVVSKKDELTLKESMLRALAYFGCAMMGSFLFALPYVRKDQKSLADVLSGTEVRPDLKDQSMPEAKSEFQLSLLNFTKEGPDESEQAPNSEDQAA